MYIIFIIIITIIIIIIIHLLFVCVCVSPIAIQERVVEMVQSVVSDSMPFLAFSVWARLDLSFLPPSADPPTSQLYVLLSRLRLSFKRRLPLPAWDHRTIKLQDMVVRPSFRAWIKFGLPVANFSVFLSYRWSHADSALTSLLYDLLTSSYTATSRHEAISVFRDTAVLRDGEDCLAEFCRAAIRAVLVVPVVSPEALSKLATHDPRTVDNVLLEWVLAILCYDILDIAKTK
jgi:hypothetical protein